MSFEGLRVLPCDKAAGCSDVASFSGVVGVFCEECGDETNLWSIKCSSTSETGDDREGVMPGCRAPPSAEIGEWSTVFGAFQSEEAGDEFGVFHSGKVVWVVAFLAAFFLRGLSLVRPVAWAWIWREEMAGQEAW